MKKCIPVLVLVLLLGLTLAACERENVVLEETRLYQVTSDIHSLDIQINAADFVIEQGDAFSIESNLKHLSVSEKNGVLLIEDTAVPMAQYTGAELKLYVPKELVLENVDIKTGAANLTADALAANSLELELGAGNVRVGRLDAFSKIDVEGGAGMITVAGGTLNNLSLEMGVGKLNLTAALLGDSDLTLGVGESNVTLIGSKEDYRIDLEKGLGSITVDGEAVTDFSSSGNGQNHVEIEGGVGVIHLAFREA